MKLSADEIFEISAALGGGLRDADMSALSKAERIKWLAAVRLNASRVLADPRLSEAERRSIQESVDFADRPDVLEERSRQRYYSRPARERNRDRAGQKMGMNDLLSHSHHFSATQRAAIDTRLSARGLPSLRSLEVALKGTHVRILKRGKIRTEEEYYVVKEVLTDVSFPIPGSDRLLLEQMAAAFEGRA